MKRNCMLFLLIMAFITCSAGTLWAVPILNISGDGFEDYPVNVGDFSIEDRFAWYANSGGFMFIGDYNNESNISLVETDIIGWLTLNLPTYVTTGFVLVETTGAVTTTGVDYDGNTTSLGASASGTYQVNTSLYPGGIEFYAVKAGNDCAVYLELGGETNGSWSTFDLWDWYREDGSPKASLEISHFTGYNGIGTPVPEPSTMLLLGFGLVGLAAVGRKRFHTS